MLVGALLVAPASVQAQNEGVVEIEARILPASSGGVTEDGATADAGSSAGIESESPGESVQDGATGEGETQGEGSVATGETPAEEAETEGAETEGSEESTEAGGDAPQSSQGEAATTNTMTLSSQNSVLVTVEKNDVLYQRSLINFEGSNQQAGVEVGDLNESTTVEVVHVTL